MGNSSASFASLNARTEHYKATNTAFAHTTTMRSTPRAEQKVHETLDPKKLNTLDEQIRECLDSEAHPETLGCVVLWDETGSMGNGAYTIQQKLATLKGATLRAGLTDLQLLFGAYGDADNNEVAPVQIGQFESGDEMADWLNNIFIEGNGGGNGHETAGLAIHFLGERSRLDSLIKRGKKAYMILTGDETTGRIVTANSQREYLGFDEASDVPIEDVIAKAKESYEIFFFLVNNGAAKGQKSEEFWSELLGPEHVIIVENLDNIAESIAMLLAVNEGMVDSLEDAITLITAEGGDETSAKSASTALAPYAQKMGTVAKAAVDGKLPTMGATETAGVASEADRL